MRNAAFFFEFYNVNLKCGVQNEIFRDWPALSIALARGSTRPTGIT